ncbi:MAG: iron chaperone [Acidimicrobiia bacterium]
MASEVDAYLHSVPEPHRLAIEKLRHTIRSILPEAEEVISYGIPMFRQGGHGVVAYNATKAGVTLQVMSGTLLDDHHEELAKYKRAKGSVQFRSDQSLPVGLIKKLVKERLAENNARYNSKKR